jgi:hypothetical protein
MNVNQPGVELGKLAIEHFSNPENTQAEEAMRKIIAETQDKDLNEVIRTASQNSGKVSIYTETDRSGHANQVDITFHPLWSFRAIGKDVFIKR